MAKHLETEIKVGLFVVAGLAMAAIAIIVLGSTESLLVSKNHYTIHFPTVEGLVPGARVTVGGLQVGTVENAEFDDKTHQVSLTISVQKSSATWIRKDAQAEIATQGVLGDKFIMLSPGDPSQPELPSGSDIPPKPSQDIAQFLSKSDQLMASINSLVSGFNGVLKSFEFQGRSDRFFEGMANTAKNLSSASDKFNKELDNFKLKAAIGNLNSILEKINHGDGTIGALINDPELYDDAKALVGGANRNRIMRNLVRQTIHKSDEADATANAPTGAPAPKK
jgi:phospholipid/cholesterol/gamma-HCH transport system substrate-binding protein